MDGIKGGLDAGLGLLVSCGTGRAVQLLAHILSSAFRNMVLNVRAHEIEHLTQQLRSQNSGRREEAARLLGLYAAVRPLYRTWIFREGAVPRLVPLLKSRNMRARLAAADAVRYLALDKDVRDEAVRVGAVPRLTRLLRRRYVYRLRISAARALGTLAVGKENVAVIVAGTFVSEATRTAKRLGGEVGGPPAGRYRNKAALLAAVLDLLARLCEDGGAAEECRGDGELFAVLAKLMGASESDVVHSALALILKLLVGGPPGLKTEVTEAGLVPKLLKMWQSSSGPSQTALDVLAVVAEVPACHGALREGAEKMRWVSKPSLLQLEQCMDVEGAGGSRNQAGVVSFLACLCANSSVLGMLRKTGIIATLRDRLSDQASPDQHKASLCQALAALCVKSDFRKQFEEDGAVPLLVEMLFAEGLELVDAAVQALCRFASSEPSQMVIATPKSLERLLELQTSDNNSLVCGTLELLRQLSQRLAVQELLREVEIPVR
ncbi:unnamed protein product [Ostreobium quekettii]|uniref:Uncharacterized protein n=1 Tax=Ostreobium quekettii TaxID=121088 RepID=A0A8S1ILY4_9CHLO|nr:unnamed protein product [Ostreobium quekettii]